MDLDAYRVRAEALARALNAAHYERHTGRTSADDTAVLVASYDDVLAPVAELLESGRRRLARFAVEVRVSARPEQARAIAQELGWGGDVPRMWADLAGADLEATLAAARVAARAEPQEPMARGVRADGPAGAAVRNGLADLGVSVEHVPGLGRAFTAALEVPQDVRVVLPPDARLDVLLHEAGHAALLASVAPDAPFEDRYLIDRAVAEATAYGFEKFGDPDRARRLAVGLLRDVETLDDPLLHRLDYFRALSTAPRTDLRFALRAS